MNKQRGLVFIILILAAVALFFASRGKISSAQKTRSAESADAAKSADAESSGQAADSAGAANVGAGASSSGAGSTAGGSPATALELQSLKKMTDILALAIQPNAREADLLKALTDAKQEPSVAADNNPITGEMDIVRTQNPPAGTRYFHAQYFGAEKKEKFAQHLSFEFKPGPEAIKQAIAAVQASLHVGAPEPTRENFYEWKLKDGYCAWVAPLAEKDLKNNPFNAYSPEDKGTIRVAVEICEQED